MKVFEKIECLFPECNHRSFNCRQALGLHVRRTHKKSKAEYAELFKTDEWIACPICGKYHYVMMVYQKLGRSCCSKECHYKASSQSFIKRNKEHPEEVAKRAQHIKAARLANDLDSYKKSGAKAAITSKENNTNKIGAERFKKLLLEDETFRNNWLKKHRDIVEMRRNRGDFNFERMSKTAQQAAETVRRNGTKSKQVAKCKATKIANGSVQTMLANENYINRKSKFKKGYYISTKTNVKYLFDSSYEYIRFRQLDEDPNVLLWHKNRNQKISYQKYNIKTDTFNEAKYFPDIFVLYINGSFEIEEIKGQETLNSWIKCDAIQEFCKNNNVNFKYFCSKNLFLEPKWKTVHKAFMQNYKDRYTIYE